MMMEQTMQQETEQLLTEEHAALLESVKAALDGLADEDAEIQSELCSRLAALSEGFDSTESWAAAKSAREQELAGLKQQLSEQERTIEQLGQKANELTQVKAWIAAQFFDKMGAVDGEYLVQQLDSEIAFEGGKLAQPETLLQTAKERFPALFRRKLTGVRPAVAKEVQEPAREMSFLERAKLFSERPGDYRRAFGK